MDTFGFTSTFILNGEYTLGWITLQLGTFQDSMSRSPEGSPAVRLHREHGWALQSHLPIRSRFCLLHRCCSTELITLDGEDWSCREYESYLSDTQRGYYQSFQLFFLTLASRYPRDAIQWKWMRDCGKVSYGSPYTGNEVPRLWVFGHENPIHNVGTPSVAMTISLEMFYY